VPAVWIGGLETGAPTIATYSRRRAGWVWKRGKKKSGPEEQRKRTSG